MTFFSSTRCVLILGDEGLQIFNVSRLSAKFVDFVPWDTVDFEVSVADMIVRKCKRKPIVILNDMVEQHYRKERLPKVGVMDRANVLKRRLGIAFPNYKVRAALKLDDKTSNIPKEGKGAAYLFAAIPATEAFSKTMEAVRQSCATVVGFYLLPIEASLMVKALSNKVSKGARKAVWTIFMGQHQSGGVRQVVTRDGELALTRMTPIVDTDIEPALWAKEVSGELSATMSYLSRFGYSEGDGLNVIIIGNEGAETHLTDAVDINCNLQVLTSQQAGKLLGVNVGGHNDSRYADPLHAAYLGRKSKFRLPMQAVVLDSMIKPRRAASFVAVLLFAACCYLGYNIFSNWSKSLEVKEELRVVNERKKSIGQEYELELAKKKEIGFDFVLVSNSVSVFNEIDKAKIKPLGLLKGIGQSLGADLSLDKVVLNAVELEKPPSNQYGGYQEEVEADPVIMEAVMTLSFDSSVDPDLGVRKTNNLRERLQDNLPSYDVSIIKQVADLSYTGNFVGDSGGGAGNDTTPEDYEAEIVVRGPVR